MDLITGAIVIVGLKETAKPTTELVKEFLSRVLAPTADAIGTSLAHPIVEWQKRRIERANRLVEEAAAAVSASGQEPQPVPGRLLLPILEHGSMEEDEDLRQQWTALLTNAAIRPGAILPSFVTILAELSSVEARLLDRLYEITVAERGYVEPPDSLDFGRYLWFGDQDSRTRLDELFAWMNLPLSQVEMVVDNLERLALMRRTNLIHFTTHDADNDAYVPPVYVGLTRFGAAFVSACSHHSTA